MKTKGIFSSQISTVAGMKQHKAWYAECNRSKNINQSTLGPFNTYKCIGIDTTIRTMFPILIALE